MATGNHAQIISTSDIRQKIQPIAQEFSSFWTRNSITPILGQKLDPVFQKALMFGTVLSLGTIGLGLKAMSVCSTYFYQYFIVFVWVSVRSAAFSSEEMRSITKKSEIQEYLNAQTNLADQLLVGYDKRFIPAIPDKPLKVKLEILIRNVLRLDEQGMECELIIFIRQKWTDVRLSWNKTSLIGNNPASIHFKKLKIREHLLDKIWLPDIRIANLKEMNQFEKFGGINMNIHPSGRVYYSQLALVRIHCPMDLRNFPMDQQSCYLNFSSYAYGKSLLTFVLQKKEVRPVNLPQFEFVEAKECVVENQETLKVKRISVALIFKRRSGFYILQIYIPSISLVILSWLAFLLDPTDIANRLVLVTTMLVSMVFLHTETNTSLPPVSYAKATDWFVLVSFGFILLALLETSWVYRTSTKSKAMKNYKTPFLLCKKQDEISAPEKQDKESSNEQTYERNTSRKEHDSLPKIIDKLSMVLFPLTYGGFNIFYWFYFMNK